MGTRAFSHESIFMPDGRTESEESIQAMSQDNLVGKVKTLQQQLAKNIKFGQPSQMTVSVKTPGEASGSLEADVLLNNPMETVMPPDVVLPENHHKSAVMPDSLSPTSLGETSHDRDEKVTPVKVSSRPKRHHSPSGTIETVNLDAIPLPTSCLDNSAAKHKLSVRPKNQRVSKKHRLSKEVQSLIETDFGQDILESQGTEDKVTKDDSYYRPDKLTQHGEVHEQKTEGKRKQDHWIHLEAGKKEQMAETKFKSPMEHKRLQEFEGSQGEQVGKKLKLQEEQLYEMEEKKDQDHQEKGLKEQERQGRNGEGPEKLQAQIPKKSQDLEEQKQTDQEQAQHELEAQRQQEQRKPREMDTQWQKEKKKKQQELEAQRQQVEAKRQGELEVQRQQQEEQKRQCEMELQRQQEEAKRQLELEVQRQHKKEQKRQYELEVQSQRQEEARKQHELEIERQRETEQKRQRELELHRQRKEEQKRHELELQRQREEEQKRHELELQRQREEEQKRHELELQRQREEEQKRQRELELQRQQEVEQKRQRELELHRQREEEQKRHELELQRQREEEQKRHELELQRQREEEQKRQRELVLQREREEEQKRQRELELQREREEEQKRHELELQRQREEEQKRHELELQRQREVEQKRQRELELQRQREEEQKRQRELEQQRQREEEQKRQRELEQQRQREEEQKRQRELEIQRQREEEAKRQGELEIQRQRQEEQKRREQETQRQQEEKKQYEQEEQKHKDCTIQKEQKVKDPKEEKRHQETELNDNLIQQGWKEKKEEPEKQKAQEEKISHPYLEKQKMKELKTVQTEKLSELNQQLLPEQKREIGQKKKEQENSKNLDDRNKLQEKAMKLKGQEEQQQNLNEKHFSTNEQKQQKSAKSVGSTEHSKIAPAETGHLRAEEEAQQEEFTQRTEGEQLERHKILSLEDQQSLEKPKEEKKSHQLHMKKHREDEHLETVEKELLRKEEPRQQQRTQPGKEQKEEGSLRVHQAMNVEVEEQGRVLGEELRWQEVDARQTMSRGFTFQVSSGEKEIIFPKVNLSPVTPMKEAPLPSATKEFKDPKSSRGSSSLPTSSCVPHTAILVTGAQLCGTAVNLNQIKDTACKSLLGLTEEKKAMEAAQTESIQKPVDGRPNSTKAKHIQDAVDNQAILDEWASIRSKILKGAENDKFNEKDSGSHNRHSDDWTAKGQSTSHGNLRKTLSANAKFSITPAWQKFSEIPKTAAENKTVPEAENAAVQPSPSTLHSDNEAVQTESPVGTKNVGTSPGKIRGRQEVAGNTEGCKFAKDLPSFLVPSLPYSPNKELSPSVETSSAVETQHNVGSKKLDRPSPGGEENVSPFGVKLRRTNYSLRFHYDQQAEQKKKKRYSAGDSFDGLPTPLTPDNEQDAKPLFLKDSKSLSQDKKDARLNSDNATLTIISRNYTIVAPVSSPTGPMSAPSQEKSASKSPLPPKPALAPKPISQTPPTSPLTKPRRSHFTEPIGKRVSKVEPDTSWRKSEGKGSPHPSQVPSESKNEEEESREKKSFFPSITMPWREKAEKKPEPLKKERPVLQSRHSIDGSKVMEKGETAQPLWITLALQKQKGFREQQATREERRQAREAKQAEKLAKENASVNNQADNKSNNVSRSNVLQKSTGPEEEKKMETATSRFERREQFKKSNTLPSSVTVEITDSLSSSPLAKEVTKRFSTPDANPVSTEPAWLALAKRKAKAWSDCPQIIK
ncbi:capping protein-inhibiting regulator of actin dynamics [Pituophis catenifer annectens]|uniref:capping protein-inhibiting regulator of actin dynamics n=1 Tax=Pituophis catenifer annectens TaxID=94852 RepID=UPI003996A916